MTLSCLPVAEYPAFVSGARSICDWARDAVGMGLDAIDLSVLMTRRLDARAGRSTAADLRCLGMPVDIVATYTDFTHPDPDIREGELEQFAADLRTAAELGAACMRVTAGQDHPETSHAEGIEWAVTGITRAAELAQPRGVRLLFENHSKPGVWSHADFAGPPERYFEIVRRLAGSDVGLLFDTANACYYGQDPVAMLGRVLPRLQRVHVADIIIAETFTPVPIGRGQVPLLEVFRWLRRRGFDGGMSIEASVVDSEDGMRKVVDTTRRLWAEAGQ